MAKGNSKDDNGSGAEADLEFDPKGSPKALATAANQIIRLEKRRKAVNEEISAIREDIQAKGWSKKGFAAAIQYFKLDPLQRIGMDETYAAARAELDVPFEPSLPLSGGGKAKSRGAAEARANA